MQKFMLGAYWGARPESLESCAQKSAKLFAGIAETDPLLAKWYERGKSRKEASQKQADVTKVDALRDLFLRGRNRRDVGGVIEELGFRLALWNGAGEEDAEAALSIHCAASTQRVGNSVLIDLPCRADPSGWVGNAAKLLSLVVETWRPDRAGIMSKRAMRERAFDGDRPFVDWMVYVPGSVPAVPPPGEAMALSGSGSIVIVQPDPPTGDDPDELARIRQVEALFAR